MYIYVQTPQILTLRIWTFGPVQLHPAQIMVPSSRWCFLFPKWWDPKRNRLHHPIAEKTHGDGYNIYGLVSFPFCLLLLPLLSEKYRCHLRSTYGIRPYTCGEWKWKSPKPHHLVKMDALLRIPWDLTCLHTACLQIHTLQMQNLVKGICLQKSLLHSQMHAMSLGFLSLIGIGLNSQLSLEQLGESGMFFHENSRHCVEKKMKPCLWTTLGARTDFSDSVLLKHQQWPTFWALVAHWRTHQSSRACFSFLYLHKFPYGMEK